MLKTKVLVSDIDNLTDARYFASWMVDWICFNLDPTSKSFIATDKLLEITSWLEGTPFALQISVNSNKDQIFEAVSKANIKALLVEDIELEILESFPDLVVFNKKANTIVNRDIPTEKYQQLGNLEALDTIIDNNNGVYLQAAGEEITGFKDFDQFDEIFEKLEMD